MSAASFEPTPLEERMRKHTPGQLTWPEPKLGKWCSQCRHYLTYGVSHVEKGRCDLVKAHQRVAGAQFKGAEAMACSKFEEGVHPRNREKSN